MKPLALALVLVALSGCVTVVPAPIVYREAPPVVVYRAEYWDHYYYGPRYYHGYRRRY